MESMLLPVTRLASASVVPSCQTIASAFFSGAGAGVLLEELEELEELLEEPLLEEPEVLLPEELLVPVEPPQAARARIIAIANRIAINFFIE